MGKWQMAARVDAAFVAGLAARADEAPVAEGRPQALAAGHQQVAEGGQGSVQVGVERSPAGLFGPDQRFQAPLDLLGDLAERGRRNQHQARLGHRGAVSPIDAGTSARARRQERSGKDRPCRTTLDGTDHVTFWRSPAKGDDLPRWDQAPGDAIRRWLAWFRQVAQQPPLAANHLRGPQTFTVQRWTTSFLR